MYQKCLLNQQWFRGEALSNCQHSTRLDDASTRLRPHSHVGGSFRQYQQCEHSRSSLCLSKDEPTKTLRLVSSAATTERTRELLASLQKTSNMYLNSARGKASCEHSLLYQPRPGQPQAVKEIAHVARGASVSEAPPELADHLHNKR